MYKRSILSNQFDKKELQKQLNKLMKIRTRKIMKSKNKIEIKMLGFG